MKSRILVRKNPYAYPNWVVSYQDIPVGAAHSALIAQKAAAIAGHYAQMINPANLCPSYLIANVEQQMAAHGLNQFWTAERISGKQPLPHPQKDLKAA